MKITFLGAAKTVTGSCYLVETKSCSFLVDCGMFQGHSKEITLNQEPFPFDVSKLSFILLTHAHIDHSGRIPKIYKDGFKGTVYTTHATRDLCSIMLPDSGHIQETEAEWINRKRERAGKHPIEPLYTYQDGLDCIKLFKGINYGEAIKINDDVKVRFNDAGHILGSAMIEVWVYDRGEETKLVFSGDIGNRDIPILRDPSIIESADYVIMESTYGDRLHKDNSNKVDKFIDIVNETIEKGGNVVIPSFAVGRTQEIIYDIHKKREKFDGKLKKLLDIPVFIDSPLAISATEVFRKNLDCYDDEARQYIENGDNPLDFPGLQFTRTADESKELNNRNDSAIIISASGMCEAGRIKHHLKHNLWREDSTVLFVGYQAVGTLGRKIVEGAKKVRIFGEEITVKARIETIDGFSGHADRDALLAWISRFNRKPKKVFIVHGEEDVMKSFSELIETKLGIETVMPDKGQSYVVSGGKAFESMEKPEVSYKFKRLAVIELLETMKEEFNELAEILKNDMKDEKEDFEIDEIRIKLKNLEKQMIDVLR
ncbi:MAG TPA: MBL fold metallo-hydrolase [Pseudobacteroides sp.]|nr:MBL fold metallo-hydrolase [Pseudobacteroides sp.]